MCPHTRVYIIKIKYSLPQAQLKPCALGFTCPDMASLVRMGVRLGASTGKKEGTKK